MKGRIACIVIHFHHFFSESRGVAIDKRLGVTQYDGNGFFFREGSSGDNIFLDGEDVFPINPAHRKGRGMINDAFVVNNEGRSGLS